MRSLTRPLLEVDEEDEDALTPKDASSTPTQKRPRVPSSGGAVQVTLSSSRDQLDHETNNGGAMGDQNQRDYMWQQRRVVCNVWIPLLFFVVFCITLAASGIILVCYPSLVPNNINNWLVNILSQDELIYFGYSLIAASFLIPFSFLTLSMWCAVPGLRHRQRTELLSDSTLNEIALSSKSALRQHITVFSPKDQRPIGIIILIQGCGCPRETTFVLAKQLSSSVNGVHSFRAICVDLPGHGTLSRVKFSYARSERLLKYLILSELEEIKKAGRNGPSGVSNSFKMATMSSVILYAYGGSFNFAMQFAQSQRHLVSGLAVAGRVENFGDRTIRIFLLESLLRLRSACAVAAVSVKGRVIASHGEEFDKSAILSKMFDLSVLPDMIREARMLRTGGSGAFKNLNLMGRESLSVLNRDICFFGSEKMISKLKGRLGEERHNLTGKEEKINVEMAIDVEGTGEEKSTKNAKGNGLISSTMVAPTLAAVEIATSSSSPSLYYIVARGVRDELVATLEKTKNVFLAKELLRFALTSFTNYGIEMEILSQRKRQAEEESNNKTSSEAAEAIVSSAKRGGGRAHSGGGGSSRHYDGRALSGSSRHYSGSSRHSSLPSRMSSPTSDQLRSSLSGTSTTPTLSSSLTREISGILIRSISREDYGSFGEGGSRPQRKSSAGVRFADS